MQCERVRPARLASALSLVVQVLNFGHPFFYFADGVCHHRPHPNTLTHTQWEATRERERENSSLTLEYFFTQTCSFCASHSRFSLWPTQS